VLTAKKSTRGAATNARRISPRLNGPARKNAELMKSVGDALLARIEKQELRIDRVEVKIDTRVDAVDTRVDSLEREVSNLQTVVRQMPDKDGMHRLELGIEKVTGEINTLSERLKPIDILSRRLQEVLLERAKS
jgi:hypothetical protein